MNQGIIASLLVLCFLILVGSGWFQETLNRFKLKKYHVVVLLLSYFYFTSIWFQVPNTNLAINIGGTFFPIFLLIWIYVVCLNRLQISESICASMLSASILLLVHEVFPKDPKLFVIDHFVTYPLLLAVTTLIIIKNPLKEKSLVAYRAIASVILSVLILDVVSVVYIPNDYYGYIGDGYANDLMFLGMLLLVITYKILDVLSIKKRLLFFQKE